MIKICLIIVCLPSEYELLGRAVKNVMDSGVDIHIQPSVCDQTTVPTLRVNGVYLVSIEANPSLPFSKVISDLK